MKIHQIIFSPTGGIQRVSEILCPGIGKDSVVTDLCVKDADIQFSGAKRPQGYFDDINAMI